MAQDLDDEIEQERVALRDQLFAHAFMNQNPDLFSKLYPELTGADEDNIEWLSDPNEFEAFVAEHFD